MTDVDFSAPELRSDPHPTFARLRAEMPICPIRKMRAYFISRYADCTMLLKDKRIGFENLSQRENVPAKLHGYYEMRDRLMLFQNPPEHGQTRKSGDRQLREMSAADLEILIRDCAETAIDSFVEVGGDFIEKVARPFVAEVIVKALGIRGLDLQKITTMAQGLADSLDPLSDLNSRSRAGELYLSFKEEVKQGCPFSGEPDLATTVMLVAAGLQTTGHILGLAVHSLLQEGGRAEISAQYAEEMFRYHSPAQMTRRVVLEPITLREKTLQPGTVLWLGLASANRDEAVFTNGNILDFERSPNRHLAFGTGSHACIGAKMARMQLRIFLTLFQQKRHFFQKPGFDFDWNGNLLFKGLARLILEKN